MNTEKVSNYHKGQKFIQGPLPFNWFALAAISGGKGKALAISILIWRKCRMNEHERIVKVSKADLRAFGIERQAYYRGLVTLERAGLIEVFRKRGTSSRIKILNEEL